MHLFSQAKNGVSAAELQRHLGVTYKCAHRIGHKIRGLTKETHKLKGVVEADETIWGGKRRRQVKMSNKSVIFGAVQRGGKIQAEIIPNLKEESLLHPIRRIVKKGSHLITDEFRQYKNIARQEGYKHSTVHHSVYEYVRGDVYTNTVEGFWSQLKRSLHGTHHSVSKKYLPLYLSEHCFRRNHRKEDLFPLLLSRAIPSPD